MITYLHLYQKLTFIRMSTPQCHEINVMTFDAECHEICFVGRKTNVMTLMSWDLENVMRFIFSGTGPRAITATFWPRGRRALRARRPRGPNVKNRKMAVQNKWVGFKLKWLQNVLNLTNSNWELIAFVTHSAVGEVYFLGNTEHRKYIFEWF